MERPRPSSRRSQGQFPQLCVIVDDLLAEHEAKRQLAEEESRRKVAEESARVQLVEQEAQRARAIDEAKRRQTERAPEKTNATREPARAPAQQPGARVASLVPLLFLVVIAASCYGLYRWFHQPKPTPSPVGRIGSLSDSNPTRASGLPSGTNSTLSPLQPRSNSTLGSSRIGGDAGDQSFKDFYDRYYAPKSSSATKLGGDTTPLSGKTHIVRFEAFVGQTGTRNIDFSYHRNLPGLSRFTVSSVTVIDTKSGLTWAVQVDTSLSKARPATSTQLRNVVAYNSRKYGGYSDWRVPTKDEMLSVCKTDYDRDKTKSRFPAAPSSAYWVLDSNTGLLAFAFAVQVVDVSDGLAFNLDFPDKGDLLTFISGITFPSVRPVRGTLRH